MFLTFARKALDIATSAQTDPRCRALHGRPSGIGLSLMLAWVTSVSFGTSPGVSSSSSSICAVENQLKAWEKTSGVKADPGRIREHNAA
jgi:hypothetical protein